MTLNELYEQIGEHLKANPEHMELIVLQRAQGDMVTSDVTFDFYPCGFEKIESFFGDEIGYEKYQIDDGKYVQPFLKGGENPLPKPCPFIMYQQRKRSPFHLQY